MKIQDVPVDELEFDLKNPRIARFLEIYAGPITAERIALALEQGTDSPEGETYATFQSLREAIKISRGLIQPIIVNELANGKKITIEGNTRLQIYREFRKQGVTGSWDTIPAIIHDNLSNIEIDAIRLQSHMVGPRPWDPYSKAKYLNNLSKTNQMTLEQIVEYVGGRRKQVMDFINAYNDMETYYRPILASPEAFDATRFSAFVELQRIKPVLVEAGHDLTDFSKWVDDGLLTPSQQVRNLPRILPNLKAKEIFLRDGANEAMRSLQVAATVPSLADVSLPQIITEMLNRLASIPFQTVQRMRENAKDEGRESLIDLKDNLESLVNFITEGRDD